MAATASPTANISSVTSPRLSSLDNKSVNLPLEPSTHPHQEPLRKMKDKLATMIGNMALKILEMALEDLEKDMGNFKAEFADTVENWKWLATNSKTMNEIEVSLYHAYRNIADLQTAKTTMEKEGKRLSKRLENDTEADLPTVTLHAGQSGILHPCPAVLPGVPSHGKCPSFCIPVHVLISFGANFWLSESISLLW